MITSKDNPLIKQTIRLRANADERRARGLFFLEGYRLCADALASGYVPETLFMTGAAREKYPIEHENVTLISEAVAQKLGDTVKPQGVFGIFPSKPPSSGGGVPQGRGVCFWRTGGRYLALENVQNPDNLGAVARTAEALGLDGLIVSRGCDMYHPKALRASMGALLRLPVLQAENLCDILRASDLPCYAAVPDADALSVTSVSFGAAGDFAHGGVILIGNEGSGLSEEAIAACAQKITIPMRGRAESLNAAAAAAILCWEMVRVGVACMPPGI